MTTLLFKRWVKRTVIFWFHTPNVVAASSTPNGPRNHVGTVFGFYFDGRFLRRMLRTGPETPGDSHESQDLAPPWGCQCPPAIRGSKYPEACPVHSQGSKYQNYGDFGVLYREFQVRFGVKTPYLRRWTLKVHFRPGCRYHLHCRLGPPGTMQISWPRVAQ